MLHRFWNDKRGVTAIEYGIIAALISVVIIGILTAVGQSLWWVFWQVGDAMFNALNAL